ncbi:SRPBCC family protein [Streptomyces sp. NPDC085466]|uniref:SRPBCC family protein n=1 Tax=Streptomyces sp. NPDC085466 TaxID=3365725 RepID=UPI0037D543F2
MDWCRYRFRSVWRLAAPPARVYAVLARAEEYPRWWPQVRAVVPHDLDVTARAVRHAPEDLVLEVRLHGDLEGWARWTLTADGPGTHALYEQEVEVRARLLRLLAVPGRPFFRANHALMMRGGRRGLAALLRSE